MSKFGLSELLAGIRGRPKVWGETRQNRRLFLKSLFGLQRGVMCIDAKFGAADPGQRAHVSSLLGSTLGQRNPPLRHVSSFSRP